ncbi:MAG: M23 family metallopeptidase [Deltaproteobacteria bacterium]|jgi:murein DD-endopeptidase MepM/ murein hydrolase activator NlpD|nr:M23 family metallopeptidase [Deltaproteobacteria bacterium]MBT6491396.1 M23 family metallopeptidase [Deltaproteobacteria bacterium]
MQDKRFILVIMDSTGARTRRVTVMRSTLIRAGVALVCLACLGVAVGTHAVQSAKMARLSLDISKENKSLKSSIDFTEAQARQLEVEATRAEISASVALSRAGLRTEASLLGSGPLDVMPVDQSEVNDDEDLPSLADDVIELSRTIDRQMEALIEDLRDTNRLLQNTPALRPTSAGWYTSGFGKRIHPVTGKRVMHKGLDIAGYTGMEILAPADGMVIWQGGRGGYGKTVVLDHGYGVQSHFAHLNNYRVRLGQRVHRGEVIAEMGSTGISTGPHLHYEVRRHGRPLDPRNFILD